MKICGLQKMTLLDYPGRVACTVFLGGCDFRCPFCHNFDLATGKAPAVMDEAELFGFLERRRGLLDGVAITGGEPCVYADLPDLLGKIRDLGYPVKLDTNGYHPEMLRGILKDRLADYVAMDIKNSPEKYARTAGLAAIDSGRIRESADCLIHGTADYEFRTTVVRELHEEKDIEAIANFISGAKRYFLQPFADREQVPFAGLSAPSREQMLAMREIAARVIPETAIRGMD
ncbi:MAG: anaerobic ribonucleoside-triphosphate reductase activating protein [Clostridia bacterium]|nr:anaerobic ribonucleoside-triphosphate reductase activating protein [Clostridia bacterium]